MLSMIGASASAVAALPSATAAPSEAPPDISKYSLVCFCTSRVSTPHGLVNMDNNGRLLHLLREPRTVEELQATGEPFARSQLRLLLDWGLVERTDGKYRTAIPILGPAELQSLRRRLRPAAATVPADLGSKLPALASELARRGRSASGQALLFGYMLDGTVWDELRSRKLLPENKITVERPFWDGTFWAVYPKKAPHVPGTNHSDIGNVELRTIWAPAVLDQIGGVSRPAENKQWAAAVAKAPPGGPYPPAPRGSALTNALIVDERVSGDLFRTEGERAGRIVADALIATKLTDVIPNSTAEQRMLIAAHEFIWLVLDDLAKHPAFRPPPALTQGARAPADLAPLVVVRIRAETSPKP